MDWDQFKINLTDKYNYLLTLDTSDSSLIESCISAFTDIIDLKLFKNHVKKLRSFVLENFRLSNDEIISKYDKRLITKIFILQITFFMSFYSFLVLHFSYELDESSNDEFVSWAVDILYSLSIEMGKQTLENFVQRFTISFSDTLSAILSDISAYFGLDVQEEISDDIDIEIPVKVDKRKSLSKEIKQINETVEKPAVRALFSCDLPISQITVVNRKSRKSESSRRNSKKEKKDSSKKVRKRKSLAPETPNHKSNLMFRHERPALVARRVLKGKRMSVSDSPVPNRTPLTPTTLRKFQTALQLPDIKLRKFSAPITETDKQLIKQADEERSLTQYSLETVVSNEKLSNSSSKPAWKFKSKLYSFKSPIKTPESSCNVPPSPRKRFFSPIKNSPTRRSPVKSSAKSPRKSAEINFFSPIKRQRLESPLITVLETNTLKTPLKSCLKSPLRNRNSKRSLNVNSANERSAAIRRPTASNVSGSVLLSPKVKQRLFVPSQPSKDYCEETMFMDTRDFIRFAGSNERKSSAVNFSGSSQSSATNSPSENATLPGKRNKFPSKQLFVNISSDIDAKNILPSSRRSMLAAPSFTNIDSETDISNSLK